ncbi:hypothetical protein Cgig2_016241 [Carnegiea gigantea]|uniref:DUF4283 domain-containing protein n=1 Tax=Carnegiea gigantea TaxID=171969 RepID=A0A9Q1Q5J0_9CARY|nr:hypothetical protein Cgig2_016241 [Carnegiea gigantea]
MESIQSPSKFVVVVFLKSHLGKSFHIFRRYGSDSTYFYKVEYGETKNPNSGSHPIRSQNEGINAAKGTCSYRDILQGIHQRETFSFNANPLFADGTKRDDCDSDDDKIPERVEDKPLCPTILLSKAEKSRLRRPWWQALILRMFDGTIGYMQLRKRLQKKLTLKGELSLIAIGRGYFIARFTQVEDYEYVPMEGPWLINDRYLMIREWVPNFIPGADLIRFLRAWVRVPRLPVEYFDTKFLKKIATKLAGSLGWIIRRPIDLTKPLLSKFQLKGRTWGIQYEGLKLIWFKCGKSGHREAESELFHVADNETGEGNTHATREKENTETMEREVNPLSDSQKCLEEEAFGS